MPASLELETSLSFITFIYLGVCSRMFLHASVLMCEVGHSSTIWAQGSDLGDQTWQSTPMEASGQRRHFSSLISVFIYFTSQSQLPLPFSSQPWSLSPQRRGGLHGCQPSLAYRVAVELGSSSTEATQGSPVGGKESKAGNRVRDSPCCCLRSPT